MGGKTRKRIDFTMPFEEALERFIRVDPNEMAGRGPEPKGRARGSHKPLSTAKRASSAKATKRNKRSADRKKGLKKSVRTAPKGRL